MPLFTLPLAKSDERESENKGDLYADLIRTNMLTRVFCLNDITPLSKDEFLNENAEKIHSAAIELNNTIVKAHASQHHDNIKLLPFEEKLHSAIIGTSSESPGDMLTVLKNALKELTISKEEKTESYTENAKSAEELMEGISDILKEYDFELFLKESALDIFTKEFFLNKDQKCLTFEKAVYGFALQSFSAVNINAFFENFINKLEKTPSDDVFGGACYGTLINAFPNSVRCVSKDFQENMPGIDKFFPPLPIERKGMIAQAVTNVMCLKEGGAYFLLTTDDKEEKFPFNALDEEMGNVLIIQQALKENPNKYKPFLSISSEHTIQYDGVEKKFKTTASPPIIETFSKRAKQLCDKLKLTEPPQSADRNSTTFFNIMGSRRRSTSVSPMSPESGIGGSRQTTSPTPPPPPSPSLFLTFLKGRWGKQP
jgi:hypothetical protein